MPTFTNATPADLTALSAMMRDFYAGEHLTFSPDTLAAVGELIASPALGAAVLIHDDAHNLAGYFILTFAFSLERAGKTALLDELFILPAHRGKSLGKAALAHARTLSAAFHCRTLLLEVDHANIPALALYRRAGFQPLSRHLMIADLP